MLEKDIYVKPTANSWSVIPVLQFLWGQPLDELTKAYLPALRPSIVRVSESGWINADAITWRVTIFTCGGIIQKIEQEVEVESTNKYPCGHDLAMAMEARRTK